MPLRFVRRLRNNMAQSLVLYVKFDARYGRRLAAPISSSKLHNPFISTLRISFRFGRNRKTLSLRAQAWQSRGNETTNFFCARAEVINYSLLIINSKSHANGNPNLHLVHEFTRAWLCRSYSLLNTKHYIPNRAK